MSEVGSMNSPDGRFTIRDDSLPHQIRLFQHRSTMTRVTCVCLVKKDGRGKTLALIDPRDDPWPAYRAHVEREEAP